MRFYFLLCFVLLFFLSIDVFNRLQSQFAMDRRESFKIECMESWLVFFNWVLFWVLLSVRSCVCPTQSLLRVFEILFFLLLIRSVFSYILSVPISSNKNFFPLHPLSITFSAISTELLVGFSFFIMKGPC